MRTHAGRVRVVVRTYGLLLLIVGLLGLGLVSWRRNRTTIPPLEDLVSYVPVVIAGLVALAFVVYFTVVREATEPDDERAPRRRDRYE